MLPELSNSGSLPGRAGGLPDLVKVEGVSYAARVLG